MKVFKREMLKYVAGVDALTTLFRHRQALNDVAGLNVRREASGVLSVAAAEDWKSLPLQRKGSIEVGPFLGSGPAAAVLNVVARGCPAN